MLDTHRNGKPLFYQVNGASFTFCAGCANWRTNKGGKAEGTPIPDDQIKTCVDCDCDIRKEAEQG